VLETGLFDLIWLVLIFSYTPGTGSSEPDFHHHFDSRVENVNKKP